VEIESQELVVFYEGNGHGRLYALPTFTDHQYVSHPTESRYPKPPNRKGAGGTQEERRRAPEGSDRIGRSMGSDPDARARVSGSHPVDNSGGRARAPDGLKNPTDRKAEIERNRTRAREIAHDLARAKQ
jgi:hypothetical protein